MFRSCCCLIVTLIFIVIGIGWNFLMHQRGDSIVIANRYIEINAWYGWDRVAWFSSYYDRDVIYVSNSTYITYDNAYETYCNNELISPPTYCSSLNNLMQAGKVYIGFNILSGILIIASITICCLIVFCKYGCNCKCPLRWFVAILAIAAFICNIIALVTFSSQFSSNLNNVLYIVQPNGWVFQWNEPRPGISIFLLICGIISGIISTVMVFTVDKNKDSDVTVAQKAYVNIQNDKEGYGTNTGTIIA